MILCCVHLAPICSLFILQPYSTYTEPILNPSYNFIILLQYHSVPLVCVPIVYPQFRSQFDLRPVNPSLVQVNLSLILLQSDFILSSILLQSKFNLRTIIGRYSQINLRLILGQSLVNQWSIIGQSQVNLRSILGQSDMIFKPVLGQSQFTLKF